MVIVKAFISYSRQDADRVAQLYQQLRQIEFLQLWIDQKDVLPGQDWHREVKREIRNSDVFLACISSSSVTKRGYLQKELRLAEEVAEEMPPGQIYRVPIRLDECDVPEQFEKISWVDYPDDFEMLCKTLEQIYLDKLAASDEINLQRTGHIYQTFIGQIKTQLSQDDSWRDWSENFPRFSLLGYRENPTLLDFFALVKADDLIERQVVELRKTFFSVVRHEAREFGLIPGPRQPNGLLGFVFESNVNPARCDFIKKQTEIDHSFKGAVMVSWVVDLSNRKISFHNNPVSWMPPVTILPQFVYPRKLLERQVNGLNFE